jgi:hypothetical protein
VSTLTLLHSGLITSVLRTVAFFKAEIFKDPSWESVDLMAYDIAEPGTYFLCACFPTFRPLLRWIEVKIKSTTSKAFYSRERLGSDSGPVEQLVYEVGGTSEGKSKSKKARGFDSILLSNISVQKSAVEHNV